MNVDVETGKLHFPLESFLGGKWGETQVSDQGVPLLPPSNTTLVAGRPPPPLPSDSPSAMRSRGDHLHEFEDNEADETPVVTDEVASLATYLQMRVQNCRCRLVTS